MSTPQELRPTPIREAFKSVGAVTGFVGAVVASAATYGLLTPDQGGAFGELAAAVPGLVTLVTTVLVAFGVVRRAEPQVTPVVDPAVEQLDPRTGQPVLVSLVGDR
jgi:hypothetical protein